MDDEEIWELARKPVTEFVESIKEMDLNVDKLVKFYLKHTKSDRTSHPVTRHSLANDQVPMEAEDEDREILSPLSCAKLELAIVFAISTCYWMYLVTHGEDPRKNDISKDIERIRLFMNRAKEVEESLADPCSSAKRPKIYLHSDEW